MRLDIWSILLTASGAPLDRRVFAGMPRFPPRVRGCLRQYCSCRTKRFQRAHFAHGHHQRSESGSCRVFVFRGVLERFPQHHRSAQLRILGSELPPPSELVVAVRPLFAPQGPESVAKVFAPPWRNSLQSLWFARLIPFRLFTALA